VNRLVAVRPSSARNGTMAPDLARCSLQVRRTPARFGLEEESRLFSPLDPRASVDALPVEWTAHLR
jgi:hypothetical protein